MEFAACFRWLSAISLRLWFIVYVAVSCSVVSLIGAAIVHRLEEGRFSFVDCLFQVSSAASSTGLTTLDSSILQAGSNVVLVVTMLLMANTMFVSALPVYAKLYILRRARSSLVSRTDEAAIARAAVLHAIASGNARRHRSLEVAFDSLRVSHKMPVSAPDPPPPVVDVESSVKDAPTAAPRKRLASVFASVRALAASPGSNKDAAAASAAKAARALPRPKVAIAGGRALENDAASDAFEALMIDACGIERSAELLPLVTEVAVAVQLQKRQAAAIMKCVPPFPLLFITVDTLNA
jgi:hypothetical protein